MRTHERHTSTRRGRDSEVRLRTSAIVEPLLASPPNARLHCPRRALHRHIGSLALDGRTRRRSRAQPDAERRPRCAQATRASSSTHRPASLVSMADAPVVDAPVADKKAKSTVADWSKSRVSALATSADVNACAGGGSARRAVSSLIVSCVCLPLEADGVHRRDGASSYASDTRAIHHQRMSPPPHLAAPAHAPRNQHVQRPLAYRRRHPRVLHGDDQHHVQHRELASSRAVEGASLHETSVACRGWTVYTLSGHARYHSHRAMLALRGLRLACECGAISTSVHAHRPRRSCCPPSCASSAC